MNHILVDYENLKSVEPAVFELEDATWTLLLGPQNRTLSVPVVQQLMARAASVDLVRLEQAGRNAVDFALAYYLGRKVLGDPAATFHVISKDTGYQPLVDHLQSRNVRIARHESFEALAAALAPNGNPRGTLPSKPAPPRRHPTSAPAGMKRAPAPAIEPAERVVAHLQRIGKSRPARKATLIRLITTQLVKGSSEEEAQLLIRRLETAGYLSINDKGGLTYALPEDRQ